MFKRSCVGNAKRPVYGIDKISSLLDEAVDKKIVSKSGSWYSFKGDKFGNGANKAVQSLLANNELMSAIKKDLYEEISKKFEIQATDVDEEHDPILDGDGADSDNLLDED